MSAEFEFSVTGNDIIDDLQAAQIEVDDKLPDNELKAMYFGRLVLGGEAHRLLSHDFLVSTSGVVLAKLPQLDETVQTPDTRRRMFATDLMFMARLDSFGYLVDANIPLDTLALTFDEPDIVGVQEEHSQVMKRLQLQVPILAIKACVLAEVA